MHHRGTPAAHCSVTFDLHRVASLRRSPAPQEVPSSSSEVEPSPVSCTTSGLRLSKHSSTDLPWHRSTCRLKLKSVWWRGGEAEDLWICSWVFLRGRAASRRQERGERWVGRERSAVCDAMEDILPYSRKIWREIKFGGLAVYTTIIKLKSAKFPTRI